LNRRDVLGLIAAGAAAFGAWTWRQSLDVDEPLEEEGVATVAAYTLRETTIVTPAEDGTPLYRLEARGMSHAVDTEVIEMDAVTLEYNHESPEPWTMTADQGQVRLDWKTIELSGHVVITATTEDNRPARLDTDRLLVEADSHRATTDSEVTLFMGEERVSGVGMVVDLMGGLVQLKSQVNGVYTP
jgi:LPS export ABC transporter protein LptC